MYFLSFGIIIGSGWLFATLSSGAAAGPTALLSWPKAAVLVIFIALAYYWVLGRGQRLPDGGDEEDRGFWHRRDRARRI